MAPRTHHTAAVVVEPARHVAYAGSPRKHPVLTVVAPRAVISSTFYTSVAGLVAELAVASSVGVQTDPAVVGAEVPVVGVVPNGSHVGTVVVLN